MKAEIVQNLINSNLQIQRCNPPDTSDATAARLENEELFTYCQRMGWSYNTDNGYLTILEGVPA
jgi:hypothetical protein